MLRCLVGMVCCLLPNLCWADNWPMWRGAKSDGIALGKGYPLTWSATENIQWKTPLPGKGHSSPIVWEDRLFVTACLHEALPKGQKHKEDGTAKDRVLICLDRSTGKILWQKTVVTAKLEPIHELNSYASSTPATDGTYVFVTFLDAPKIQIACFDFQGNLVWQKSPGEFYSKHGFCSPPILYKNMVIVNGDQDAPGELHAYIVALDKKTGEEKWRIDRPNRIRSYCPPVIVNTGDKQQMVLTGCKCVTSYDPDTGKPHWIIDGPTEQFVASMIYHKGLFFLTAGYPTYHVMAIKPDGTGNVTKTHVLWHETKGAGYVPSPVAHGENIFLVHDDGRASCRDALTGNLHWMERLGKRHSASPVEAEGRIYYCDDFGVTWVVKASSTFEVLAKNDLKEETYSSPAFVDGQIFLRTRNHLYCIETKK